MRKTRGMTSAEVEAYLFHKKFGSGIVVERKPKPEPVFRWRVTLGIVLDTEARTETEARNGLITLVGDCPGLGIKVTGRGSGDGAAYDGVEGSGDRVRRVYGIETSLLDPVGSDIMVDEQGDTK